MVHLQQTHKVAKQIRAAAAALLGVSAVVQPSTAAMAAPASSS
jgi:hypothetical protein